MNPKFIIEDDSLIMGKVNYHRDLATDKSKVKGGGWFKYDKDTNTFIFYDSSFDFGKAKLEDIEECIKSDKVYLDRRKLKPVQLATNYAYDTGTEIIKLK